MPKAKRKRIKKPPAPDYFERRRATLDFAKNKLIGRKYKHFSALIEDVELTPFAFESLTSDKRLKRIMVNMELLRFGDIHNMAKSLDIYGVDERTLLILAYDSYISSIKED